ncbi:unnamed protein product [Cochlearia groenlandica]
MVRKRGSRKGKVVATTSHSRDNEEDSPVQQEEPNVTHRRQWPRSEGTPFPADLWLETRKDYTKVSLNNDLQYRTHMKEVGARWDDFDNFFYNGMLHIAMEPSKFVCEDTLERKGVKEEGGANDH